MATVYFRTFRSRFGASPLGGMFSPRKPRNPLLRIALGVVGVLLLAILLVIGLFAGAAMIAFGLFRRLLNRQQRPRQADANVVDAEYRVVDPKADRPLLR